MAKPYPNNPPLSNRLADLAERIGEAARFYKRASVEAHKRYIEAGALLAEARAEARRGEWAGVLKRAGLEARTARNMMAIAAAGYSGESLHAVGGVKAALALLRDPPGEADAGEKTETVSAPEPAAAPEKTETVSALKAGLSRYQRRRAAGVCVVCGGYSGGAVRCAEHARRESERRKARRGLTRIGERLRPRIEEAAKAGAALTLTADEIRELAR